MVASRTDSIGIPLDLEQGNARGQKSAGSSVISVNAEIHETKHTAIMSPIEEVRTPAQDSRMEDFGLNDYGTIKRPNFTRHATDDHIHKAQSSPFEEPEWQKPATPRTEGQEAHEATPFALKLSKK